MIFLDAATAGAGRDLLSPWRWHARLLLLFAPGSDDAALKQQQALLAGTAAARQQRDLIVLALPGDQSPGFASADAATALRARFGVAPTSFTAILIGKDGGEKLRSARPLPAADLFATIDRMPMRQQEMQSR